MAAAEQQRSRCERAPSRQRRRRAAVVFLGIAVLLAGAPSLAAVPAKQQMGVLLLSFSDPDLPDVGGMIEAMRAEIEQGRGGPVHFDLEYLNPAVLAADPSYKKQIAPYLHEKYRGQRFDVVIAIGEKPLEFAERFQARLFPGAAILFVLVNPTDQAKWSAPTAGRTGVIGQLNYVPTLQLALRQNPGTRRVMVVAGSSEFEKLEMQTAREEFRPYESQLEFQYLTDLKLAEVVSRVAEAEHDSVILFLDFLADAEGEQFTHALPVIAKAASRPIYGALSSFVGNGVVGGSVADLREVGQVLGRYGLRILNGEKAENIPVITGEFRRYLFDWRQMQRWGIGSQQLPAGSTVLNREYSPWERYKWRILGLAATLVAETLLILLLLGMRAQRKKVEQKLAYRLKLEKLIGNLAASFVGLPPRLVNVELERGFKLLMDGLEFDRASLFEFSDAGTRLRLLYSRETPGTHPPPRELETGQFSWATGKLLQGEPVVASRLDQFPEEAANIKNALVQQGVRSFAALPLKADGAAFGALSFACVRGDCNWTQELIQYLQTVADIFAGALKRTQVAEELSQVNQQKAMILDSAGEGILGLDLGGNHTFVNQAAARMFGYLPEELVGRHSHSTWHHTKADGTPFPREECPIYAALRDETVHRGSEEVFWRKNGSKFYAQYVSTPIREEGRVAGAVVVFQDITERKQAEEALRESEKRFRLMADSAPVMMWLSGPDKLCTDFNKEWLDFTGRSFQQELGTGWMQGVHPADLRRCLDGYIFAFEARRRFTLEYRLRRHDGQYRWLLDHGVPRFMGDGSFAGYIGCAVDISDQKEAENARLELSGRLITAQEEDRARIARELHDDINQRLALLANGFRQLNQAPCGALEPQQQQLQRLLQLTNEIATDVQHLSHQLHPSKLQYLGLAAAVRALCQEFSRQHKVEVECMVRDLPRELEENVSLSLFRTVQESLRNVVKHSHARHAKVELTGESCTVRLRISDDGIGFDPDDPKNRRGLGLVSMRERLRSVGGELSIWSRPSLGTQVEGKVPATMKQVWSPESLQPTG